MKKILSLILLSFMLPLYAQYVSEENLCVFYTQITLCSHKNESYVLISNGYSIFPEYLIIYGDKNYSARQCYGEILLKYYHIKNMKKEHIFDDGEWYYKVKDNSEEEVAFLRSLTDEFVLADFNFFYIDDNSSKTEKVEFYDIAEDMYKEDSIGSSAGVLMGINATDFINFLKSMKD